jgi:hypothetical protein
MGSVSESKKLKHLLEESLEAFRVQIRSGHFAVPTPDPLGTARVAQLGDAHAASWLNMTQNENGSWGQYRFLPHAILAALEGAIALSSFPRYSRKMNGAIRFVERASSKLAANVEEFPRPQSEIEVSLLASRRVGLPLDSDLVRRNLARAGYGFDRVPHSASREEDLISGNDDPYSQLTYEYLAELALLQKCDKARLAKLQERQLSNGSWCGFVAVTSKVIQALEENGFPSQSNGRSWLEQYRLDLGFPHIGSLRLWCTALLHFYLERSASLPTLRTELVRRIVTNQLPSAGWGFDFGVPIVDADDTGLALRAILLHDIAFRRLKEAKEALMKHMTDEGGLKTYESIPQISTDVTIHSLFALSKLAPDFFERAVRFLKRVQREDGSFGATWHYGKIYSTSHAILELVDLGEDDIVRRGLHFMEKRQRFDGSFGSPEETGLALLAFLTADHNEEVISEGLRYLASSRIRGKKLWPNLPLWVGKIGYACPAPTQAPILAALQKAIDKGVTSIPSR